MNYKERKNKLLFYYLLRSFMTVIACLVNAVIGGNLIAALIILFLIIGNNVGYHISLHYLNKNRDLTD